MTVRQIAAVVAKIEIRTHNKIAILANMFGAKMEIKNPVSGGSSVITKKETSEDPKLGATLDKARETARKRKLDEVKRRGR